MRLSSCCFIVFCFLGGTTIAQIDTLIDQRDGHRYSIVELAGKLWLKENLAFKMPMTEYYKNDSLKYAHFGLLYTRSEAKHGCPEGCHLARLDDWQLLDEYIQTNTLGAIMDSRYWEFHQALSNKSGFSLFPGGYKVTRRKFDYAGFSASLWFWDEQHEESNYHLHVHHTSETDFRYTFHSHKEAKIRKFYVRCVK